MSLTNNKFLYRFLDAKTPYGTWEPFPPTAIVQVKNGFGESAIGLVKDFWWGYERGLDGVESNVIEVRRLDRPKVKGVYQ